MTTTCVRRFLEAELARRRAQNSRYSLRAFARRLAVDHSTLSQWIRGRRPMSVTTIELLGQRLALTTKQIRVFVENRCSEGPDVRILDLVRRHDFLPDSRWIAGELNVSVDEANVAIQQLLRLNLLAMTAADRWFDTSEVA